LTTVAGGKKACPIEGAPFTRFQAYLWVKAQRSAPYCWCLAVAHPNAEPWLAESHSTSSSISVDLSKMVSAAQVHIPTPTAGLKCVRLP
jgi:hypothetical protein